MPFSFAFMDAERLLSEYDSARIREEVFIFALKIFQRTFLLSLRLMQM